MKYLILFLFSFSLAAVEKIENKDLIISVLLAEATGEGQKGIEAVWEVINNRAKQQNKSIISIITARKQFSCLNNTTPSALIQQKSKDKNWKLAEKIVNSPLTNHTKNSNHYYSIIIPAPYWAKNNKFVCQIGKHRFYKL